MRRAPRPSGRACFRSVVPAAHIRPCRSKRSRRLQGDAGSVALELVLVAPVVLVLVLFVVLCGRLTSAQALVRDAAAAGARAASLRQHPIAARADATSAVMVSLAGHGTTCPRPRVVVDTTALRPGGQVVVEVSCTASLSDLALVGVPGTRTLTARSVQVVDRRRGG